MAKSKKGPTKAEIEATLHAANLELMELFKKKEKDLIFAKEKKFEALHQQRLLEDELKTLKRHLKEKERWGSKAAEALQKQLREQQQQEAADSKLLQQQLQQKQQQQQLLLLQQKHIAKQFDNEIGDTQRAMKELQQKCNSLEAEFLSLLQSVLQLLQQQLQQPAAVEKELAAAFEKQMQQIKNEVIFKIQNLETKSENKETLGDAWRQIGMQPPHAVTKLGV